MGQRREFSTRYVSTSPFLFHLTLGLAEAISSKESSEYQSSTDFLSELAYTAAGALRRPSPSVYINTSFPTTGSFRVHSTSPTLNSTAPMISFKEEEAEQVCS